MAILKAERQAIRDALKKKRGAHKELAERLAIKPASLSLWLKGGFKSNRISLSVYRELPVVLGLAAADLIEARKR